MKLTTRDQGALLAGPIGRTLMGMTGSMLIGHVAMAAFNIIDTWYVSRLGTAALAALGYTFPVVMITNGVMFGLGLGVGAIISRAIGQGDQDRVRRLTTHALLLTLAVGVVVGGAGLIFCRPLFAAMGASGETLDITVAYMRIWFWGFPVGGIPMVMNNAIRATGDARNPGFIMATVAVVNLVLDPLFIFGPWIFPAMGVLGAALATVIGRVISTTWALGLIHVKLRMFTRQGLRARRVLASWRDMGTIGTPAVLTMIVLPLMGAVLTRVAARYGDEAVAAWGTGGKVDAVAVMLLFALGNVLLPMIGQNAGAARWDRVRATVRFAVRFTTYYGLAASALIIALAGPLARIFSDDARVVAYLTLYLRVMPLCYVAYGISTVCYHTLMGLGASWPATALILGRNFGLQVPLAWASAQWRGFPGLVGGFVPATFVAVAVAWVVLQRYLRRLGPA